MRNFIITIILTLFSVSASAQQMADSLRVYFRQGYSTFDPKYRDNQSQVDAFISRVKTFQSESDAFVILQLKKLITGLFSLLKVALLPLKAPALCRPRRMTAMLLMFRMEDRL